MICTINTTVTPRTGKHASPADARVRSSAVAKPERAAASRWEKIAAVVARWRKRYRGSKP